MSIAVGVNLVVTETPIGLKVQEISEDARKVKLAGFAGWTTEYGILDVKVRYPQHLPLLEVREAVYAYMRTQGERPF